MTVKQQSDINTISSIVPHISKLTCNYLEQNNSLVPNKIWEGANSKEGNK